VTVSEPDAEPGSQPDVPPTPAEPGGGAQADDDGPPALCYRDAHAPLGDQLAQPAWIVGGMLAGLPAARAHGGEWTAALDPVLAVPGVALLITAAVWSLRGAARRRRAVPAEPWRGDHPWRRDGGTSRVLSPMRQLVLVVTGAIAAAAMSVTILAGGGPLAVLVVTAFAAIPFVLLFAFAVRPLLAGGVAVRWDEFPLMCGTKHTLRVRPTARFSAPRLLLVRTRWVWAPPSTGALAGEAPVVASAGAWTRLLDTPTKDGFVEVVLDLPADTPGTMLLPHCALHWELVVTGDSDYGPIEATVLLPIYADPAAATGASASAAPADA
jgi:hypothetical protein